MIYFIFAYLTMFCFFNHSSLAALVAFTAAPSKPLTKIIHPPPHCFNKKNSTIIESVSVVELSFRFLVVTNAQGETPCLQQAIWYNRASAGQKLKVVEVNGDSLVVVQASNEQG